MMKSSLVRLAIKIARKCLIQNNDYLQKTSEQLFFVLYNNFIHNFLNLKVTFNFKQLLSKELK